MSTTVSCAVNAFLWFDSQAEEATNFYVGVFPDSHIERIARYPEDESVSNTSAVWRARSSPAGSA